jgi:hypothetical protein
MNKIDSFIPSQTACYLSLIEKEYLAVIFDRFNGYPNLEQLWSLMDEPWVELACDPLILDERVTKYYQHPVWLLNGLFVERHEPSLENRRRFAQWVVDQKPKRIADFGGGFGGLARIIGEALPDVQVEVIEPHPHPAAIALAAGTPNVRFVPALSGEYDILIATDVFEHVLDPVGLAAETASYLRIGGQYLIANCFAPVILCHLPQLFHFNTSWDAVMQAMGLEVVESVVYGKAYRRKGGVSLAEAREKVECGSKIHSWISWIPLGRARVGRILMQTCCR